MQERCDRPDILLVSTADWDNPYWTNKQHVAVQLARRGHKVFYVESQGLRTPTVTRKDMWRIFRRLRRALRPPREVRPGLWVWSPLVIPLQRFRAVRAVNQALLQVGIGFWTWRMGLRPGILWTYSPLTTELYDMSRFDRVVYHAVDDIKAQPGMPVEVIARGEAELLRCADIVFTTSPNLQSLHERVNPRTFYFSNVCDYDHFSAALDPALSVPVELSNIPSPRIGFVGAISAYKLDFGMIASIARIRPDWHFVFVGEIGEGDPLTDTSEITGLGNLHFMGGQPYQSLPGWLKGMDVTILPNRLNEYTKSMFPMKFFEYLAAGRPVVATDLHALSAWGDIAALTKDEAGFTAAIARALEGDVPPLKRRLDAARSHTYESRMEKMMAVVEGTVCWKNESAQ